MSRTLTAVAHHRMVEQARVQEHQAADVTDNQPQQVHTGSSRGKTPMTASVEHHLKEDSAEAEAAREKGQHDQ